MSEDSASGNVTYREAGYFEVELQGPVTIDTVVTARQYIVEQVKDPSHIHILWDIREADLTGLTMPDVMASIADIAPLATRVSVLYDTDFQLAIARQTICLTSPPTGRDLFTRDLEAAVQWLSETSN